jgi:hypothetical protein
MRHTQPRSISQYVQLVFLRGSAPMISCIFARKSLPFAARFLPPFAYADGRIAVPKRCHCALQVRKDDQEEQSPRIRDRRKEAAEQLRQLVATKSEKTSPSVSLALSAAKATASCDIERLNRHNRASKSDIFSGRKTR